ncbi:HAD-IA family hydrolase [Pseudomonas sp. B21-048]|uniref:HAD-IA family hydrolase n=1 Tax=Pseudomonas sp. B21-048 TaxID=2895490 RepID=UPI002160008E|nr:HAD-IA family hydrolase [Pseudomonas sp. B21-048]
MRRCDGGINGCPVSLDHYKPDAPIYHTALRRIRAHLPEVAPQELVFIDDHAPNIVAAMELGWQAIHHVSAGETRRQLGALGLRFD